MKTARAFRWIWRINGVAILLVAVAALLGIAALFISEMSDNRRRAEAAVAAPVIAKKDTQSDLRLGDPRQIAGTTILRAELQAVDRPATGLSGSSDNTVTHNILFIDTATGASRLLLPSHRRVVDATYEIDETCPTMTCKPVASVVLIRDTRDAETGDLVVHDPAGTKILTAAQGIRTIHSATAVGPSELVVLFERGGRYILARFDRASLTKIAETELKVPQL